MSTPNEESGAWGGRQIVAAAAGLAVSVALLALALRNVSAREVAHELAKVRPGWLASMAGIILLDLAIRSLRWKLLLSAAAPSASWWSLVKLETIGLAVNNVLFLRIGELARTALAAKELGSPFIAVFSTIFVERMLDLMSLLALFGAAARTQPSFVDAPMPFMGVRMTTMAFAGAAAIAATLAALCVLDRRLDESVLPGLPKVRLALSQAAMGTRALRSIPSAGAILALGFSLWIVGAALFWTGGKALDLLPPMTAGRSVVTLACAAASSFLPAVPGSFGTFEQAVKLYLTSNGVAEAAALGFAGLVHLVAYSVVTSLGILLIYRTGYTLGGIKALAGARGEAAR
ncbi:MAG: flippase-like domain-containing protein [Elusimicrobia bacterium]|nr:flippase-like domain-containing protein [Elusimicrobiota bacterium]